MKDLRAKIEADYRVEDGVIRDFGQFENEPVYVAAMWECALEQWQCVECEDLNGYANYCFGITPVRIAFKAAIWTGGGK